MCGVLCLIVLYYSVDVNVDPMSITDDGRTRWSIRFGVRRPTIVDVYLESVSDT
jgi:hypothetical protein